VVLHRAFGDVQDCGQVMVEATTDDEAQDLLLAGGQLGTVVT